jgi:hypothetical protein
MVMATQSANTAAGKHTDQLACYYAVRRKKPASTQNDRRRRHTNLAFDTHRHWIDFITESSALARGMARSLRGRTWFGLILFSSSTRKTLTYLFNYTACSRFLS